MSWWEELIRGLTAIPTGGMSEMVGRQNQLGRTVTGGLEGAGGGFLTGGPLGAVMGAGTGAGLSGTGTTNPYSLSGGGINFGSGVGAGGLTHLPMMMPGGGGAGTGGPSPASMMLHSMRPGGMQQPQPSYLERIYALYPQLRPHFGGPYGV